MNKFLKIAVVLVAALGLSACVQNLDTKPIDKNSSTSFNQDRMFTKCYATLGLSGQQGPAGSGDVDDIDEGVSAFYRTIYYMNEFSSDELWWIWEDKEIKPLLYTTWDGDFVTVQGIYARLNLDIKYCNHYITYATTDTQEDAYRMAEVRFIRALNYYYLMDLFFAAPLCTEESDDFPHYKLRHELYAWLEGELKELTSLLPTQRINQYRVDQAAAHLLLARLYLNSNVYNRYNSDWSDAKFAQALTDAGQSADKAIGYGYSLYKNTVVTDSGFVYSAYQQLFMGDNHRAEVVKESVLQIYQDGIYCRSYGGSGLLIAGPRTGGMVAYGCNENWTCTRSSPYLVYIFTDAAGLAHSEAATIKLNEYEMPSRLGDDRAILCSHVDGMKEQWKISGTRSHGDNSNFFDCWACPKFTNVYTKASRPEFSTFGSDKTWADTDIPFLRIAEAYMIKAEVLFRKGDVSGALNMINNYIRDRANAAPLTELTEDELLNEWAREFWGEGRRRIDQIRFDRFYGPQSDAHKHNWEGRMDKNYEDANFVANTPEYLNWFPVPFDDKKVNPNFATDVEANPANPFAARGGDGYVYK